MTISKASLLKLLLRKMQYTTPINDIPDAATPTATNVGTSRAFNNAAATISLSIPSTGGPATNYTVTSTPGSFTATGSSPITVTGLQSGVSYTFTSVGNSPVGSSYFPSVSSNSILATTVPSTPIIDEPTKINNTNISLSFTPSENGGSEITGYTVVSSPSLSLTTSSGITSPLTVTGDFSPATSYTFTIFATNSNGNSLSSEASPSIIIADATHPAKPNAPTVTTQVNQDNVSWVAPATGGSPITSYTWASSDGKGGTVSGSTLSVQVPQEGGTSQTYTVYATNAIGNSPVSEPSSNITTTPPYFPLEFVAKIVKV